MLTSADKHPLDNVAEGLFDNPVDPVQWDAFRNDSTHHIAVAEEAGLVVGFVSVVHYLHPDKRPQCWINEVSTAPSHRRRGIASQLIRLVVDHARATSCEPIWLATETDNEPARALYRSLNARETPIVMYELS